MPAQMISSSEMPPWRERQFLTMKTAAAIAGVSPASLYRFAAEDRLHLRKLGGRTLVVTTSLITLLDEAEEWVPSTRTQAAVAKRNSTSSS